jgi:hypothetical protein
MTYTVTAELKADEMFNPNTLAKQDVVNSTNQKAMVIPCISKIKLPMITNVIVWIADIKNKMESLESK